MQVSWKGPEKNSTRGPSMLLDFPRTRCTALLVPAHVGVGNPLTALMLKDLSVDSGFRGAGTRRCLDGCTYKSIFATNIDTHLLQKTLQHCSTHPFPTTVFLPFSDSDTAIVSSSAPTASASPEATHMGALQRLRHTKSGLGKRVGSELYLKLLERSRDLSCEAVQTVQEHTGIYSLQHVSLVKSVLCSLEKPCEERLLSSSQAGLRCLVVIFMCFWYLFEQTCWFRNIIRLDHPTISY